MGRRSLPADHGMLFLFTSPKPLCFWMFNCQMNLSVAYIDKNQVIRSIQDLDAYPHMMDPKRPVNCPKDLAQYPEDDPVRCFFNFKAKPAPCPVKYALEMAQGWYKDKQIGPGDLLCWDKKMMQGYIRKGIDLSELLKDQSLPVLFKFPKPISCSVWLPEGSETLKVTFMDSEGRSMGETKLKGGLNKPPEHISAAVSLQPVSYLLVDIR
jgi:uncharacterized membrane protein (UPF0127 family)